ncbi:glycogen synthase kinase-3 alpha [Trypanosoma cruzi Dm28c]|uniref:Glycogen synthase kinase-3 alpha n=1 Tax=Trypanosoma cruzi Dm28c TaxID=1416333 RepID=V5BR38_TRYCR|nr:glycogen synthase kinase-3 alpha [Trypanosoma cruzi Dm28c]KAF8280759.1 putative glycogen synthase kinase-3 alpha [Trypanosoma cruzi]PBJ71102.1 glycogen synthase kinase-3 alpha [Trypanosoma cruzi cruzi]
MRKLSGDLKATTATPLTPPVTTPQPQPDGTDRGKSAGGQATYEPLHVLGQGSFGVVMMARVRETGKMVAVKKVLFDRRLHHRELLLLRDHLGPATHAGQAGTRNNDDPGKEAGKTDPSSTNNSVGEVGFTPLGDLTSVPTTVSYHPCIVRLLDHFTVAGPNGEQYLYIVMDYLPLDIHRLHHIYLRQKQQRMPFILVKVIIFQLARALMFLHLRGICHRDVKPSNLLIDPETGVLKLCDFGSAKVMQPQGVNGPREKNVSYICSRYYRAPELLLGSLYYHFHVDMWAAGCVLAELLCGEVLFKGASTVDQMAEIFKVLGAPSRQELLALNPQGAEALFHATGAGLEVTPTSAANTATSSDYLQRYHALRIKALQWQHVLPPNTPPAAVSLVGELLRYTPAERLSAAEVLEHSFFDDVFAEDASLPNGAPLPVSMFEVTAEEMEALPPWLLERMASAEASARRRHVSAGGSGKLVPPQKRQEQEGRK